MSGSRLRKRTRPPAESLEVIALSGTEWRIGDPRLPADDARRVLGFVELRDGTYEALLLGREFDRSGFESLDDAISHVAQLLARDSSTGTLQRSPT